MPDLVGHDIAQLVVLLDQVAFIHDVGTDEYMGVEDLSTQRIPLDVGSRRVGSTLPPDDVVVEIRRGDSFRRVDHSHHGEAEGLFQ